MSCIYLSMDFNLYFVDVFLHYGYYKDERGTKEAMLNQIG